MNINESKLSKIIKEACNEVLNEAQQKIDNFQKVANMLQFNANGDDFYFVQIIKRFKDIKFT